mgnify:CR=1 FL=1
MFIEMCAMGLNLVVIGVQYGVSASKMTHKYTTLLSCLRLENESLWDYVHCLLSRNRSLDYGGMWYGACW